MSKIDYIRSFSSFM